MSALGRDELGGRGIFVLLALVVTVVVSVGVVIVHRDNPPATGTHPNSSVTASPIADVRQPASVRPVQRLTGQAKTFDTSTGGWTSGASGTTLTRSTTTTRHGTGALELTSATVAVGTTEQLVAWSPAVKAVPGDRYVASAYVRAITAVRGAQAELKFLDSSGKETDTEPGQLVTDTLNDFVGLPSVAAIAPKGATQVQLGISFPVVGPGGMHLVDDATIGQTPGGSTDVVPPLRAVGNQILQGNGEPLMIRGLQRFGLEGGTQTPLPTNAEIGQLKQWGANEVRISLGEQKWLTTSCHYQKDYPQVVDQMVRWVTSRGMVALINLHFSSLGSCGTPGLTPMADSPGAITFWQEVANRYRTNPLVAFDLFNEPQVPQDTWLYGGFFKSGGQTYQAAGMQQLYDTVRNTGATNLVVISGLNFADKAPTQLVVGGNIAYAAHAYQCEAAPPPACTKPHPYDASVPLDHWVDFAKTTPVIITEFGWPDGDNGTYNANVIAFAEAHRWGWSGFAWDGGTDGLFDLVQNHYAVGVDDGKTIEPNSGGMPILAGFAKNTLAGAAR